MQIDKEVDLFKYSSMRTHSIASVMYTPRSVEELKEAISMCGKVCHFLGGGSNVVFASRVETPIINLMNLDNTLKIIGNNCVIAGCSVRIQKLINFGKDMALGGFEYLFSLPASIGGIVFMNAGRGRVYKQQISDWLKTITYLDINDMQLKTMQVEKTEWTYRHSPFQEMNAVILSATFELQRLSTEEVAARIQERKDIVKANQEGNKPSCGSVFNRENKYLMRLLRGKRVGGAHFSKKTNNWISNDLGGTAEDVIALIEYAKKWHKCFGLECVLEVRIFK